MEFSTTEMSGGSFLGGTFLGGNFSEPILKENMPQLCHLAVSKEDV